MFDKHERKSEKVVMEVERFTVDGKPVCIAWYGDEEHPRMGCRFLLARHFGTIYVCGVNGQDCDEYFEDGMTDFPKPVQGCPLWDNNEQNG